MAPLIGEELLQKVEELKGQSEVQCALACGYCRISRSKEDGLETKVARRAEFMRALLAAKGGPVFKPERTTPLANRNSGLLTVGKKGLVALTGNYVRRVGAEAGNRVSIMDIDAETVTRVVGPCLIIRLEGSDQAVVEPLNGEDLTPDELGEDVDDLLGPEEDEAVDPSRLELVA